MQRSMRLSHSGHAILDVIPRLADQPGSFHRPSSVRAPQNISATLVESILSLLGDPKRRLRIGWLRRSGEGQVRASCIVCPLPILCVLCQERSESIAPRKLFSILSQRPFPLPGAGETRPRIECDIEPIVRLHGFGRGVHRRRKPSS